MRERKDSGVEWIGEIPTTWNLQKVKTIFYVIGGCGFKDIFQGEETGDYPFMKASDINSLEKYVTVAANYVSQELVSQEHYNIIPKNSILMAKIGEALKKNHRHINTVDCIVDNNCQALSLLDNSSNIDFYYYLMLCVDMIWFDNGGTIPCVNNRAFLNSFISVPPVPEQSEIADFLDRKCAEIDALTADIEAQIDTLEQYKRSVITETVTKGLDPDAEMKDSGVEWIGEIPKEWGVIKVKHIAWLKGRIGWQGLTANEYLDEGPYLITGTDFLNGYISWETCVHISEERFNEAPEIHIKERDLLITKDGTIGKIAIAKNCPDKVSLNSGVMLIRNVGDYRYVDRYLYYILLSDEFWDWYESTQTGHSTIRHLFQEQFYNFKFSYPPIFEQKKIATFLDRKCAEIDAIISDKRKQLDILADYKKSLIYEYVTGKKEVPVS